MMRIAKTLQILAAAALIAGAPPALMAQQAAPPQSAANQATDASYVTAAAVGDMFEIESSRLALQRSKDRGVLDFANMMVADHGKMSAKLKTAAQSANLAVPAELDTKHKSMLKELQDAKSENAFNQAYVAAQMRAHEEALALHQTYSQTGGHTALKQVAQGAVPVVQSHFERLKMLKR
jgi:putative membrane protein